MVFELFVHIFSKYIYLILNIIESKTISFFVHNLYFVYF